MKFTVTECWNIGIPTYTARIEFGEDAPTLDELIETLDEICGEDNYELRLK